MEMTRFDFTVPDTVEDDLTACYGHIVAHVGRIFKPTPDTMRVIKSAARWLSSGKPGLFLTGKVGTGKSVLLAAISNLIAYYTDSMQVFKIFPANYICELAYSKNEEDAAILAKLKNYRYLAIDDLGTEPVNVKSWGTELSPVIDMLYARYVWRKTTFITSNYSLENISERYDTGIHKRIYDRLCEQYDRITFNFKSFRQ